MAAISIGTSTSSAGPITYRAGMSPLIIFPPTTMSLPRRRDICSTGWYRHIPQIVRNVTAESMP